MYGRSQSHSLQAAAAAAAAAKWGQGDAGREVIAHAVCKGKFQVPAATRALHRATRALHPATRARARPAECFTRQ